VRERHTERHTHLRTASSGRPWFHCSKCATVERSADESICRMSAAHATHSSCNAQGPLYVQYTGQIFKTHIPPLANRDGHDPYTPNEAWLGGYTAF
jgi:hypothetical protein